MWPPTLHPPNSLHQGNHMGLPLQLQLWGRQRRPLACSATALLLCAASAAFLRLLFFLRLGLLLVFCGAPGAVFRAASAAFPGAATAGQRYPRQKRRRRQPCQELFQIVGVHCFSPFLSCQLSVKTINGRLAACRRPATNEKQIYSVNPQRPVKPGAEILERDSGGQLHHLPV